jgi:hypothetical protein
VSPDYGAIVGAALGAVGAEERLRVAQDRRVERREEEMEAAEQAARERAAAEAVRQAEEAARAAALAQAERLRAIAEGRDEPAPAAEAPWWQRAWDGVREAADSAIAWVDQHQAVIALGVGVAVGIGAIALSAGAATPLVAAAWVAGATVVAGGVAAAGTVGLNAYFHRALETNILRNVGVSAGTAFLISGAGIAVRTGLATRVAYGIGNTVGALCVRFPTACGRAEVVLNAMDTAEQVGLQVQLAVQIALHDPRAAETALELQLEYMDGGAPGNTLVREFDDVLDSARAARRLDGLPDPEQAIEGGIRIADGLASVGNSGGGGAAARALTEALAEASIGDDVAAILSTYSGRMRAIGNLDDTGRLAGRFEILSDPNWTLIVNDAWIQEGIESDAVFYIASEVTEATIWRPERGGVSVYGRELAQLLAAGYRRTGGYMIPPSLIPH